MSVKSITLIPNWNKDKRQKKLIVNDFQANRDFIISDVSCKDNGRYANKADLLKNGYFEIKIRYNKLMDSVILKLIDGETENES